MNIRNNAIIKFRDDTFLKSFEDAILKHGRIKITGLGVFSLKKMKARKNAYNVGSSSRESFPEYIKIIFSPTKILKESVQTMIWKIKK